MEILLFWALPAIVTVCCIKKRMIGAWRLFFASSVAFYVGVWGAAAWWGLLDFLPDEAVPYRNALAIVITVGALFAILFKATLAIAPSSHDELFVFPRLPEVVLNILFRFGFGIVLSTLIYVLCCATPVKAMLRNNGDGFRNVAQPMLLKITGIGDMISCLRPELPRSEEIEEIKLWYREPEAEKPAENTPPATAPASRPNAPSGAGQTPAVRPKPATPPRPQPGPGAR